jgi:hypothetical protein
MTLTTTIGGAASDSYITLAEWASYAADQGWTLTGTDDQREAYLRRAALAVDTSYTFLGNERYSTQKRAWPRVIIPLVKGWPVSSDTIPQEVKDAQAELAFLIMGGADPLATFEGVIESERSKVGPIERDRTYLGGKARSRYTAVDRILAPYVIGGAGSLQVVRA